jgi:hypothetical protein
VHLGVLAETYSAELNNGLSQKLWPRSFAGRKAKMTGTRTGTTKSDERVAP